MSSWLSHNRRPAQNAVIVALSALLRPPVGLLTPLGARTRCRDCRSRRAGRRQTGNVPCPPSCAEPVNRAKGGFDARISLSAG